MTNRRSCGLKDGTIIAAAMLAATAAHGQSAPPATTETGQQGVDAIGARAGSASETENDTKVEDIVVTAQRRSERLQDVPIAISAVTSATLAKQGVTNVTDLAIAIPGLTVTNNNGQVLPRVRGIASTGTGAGVENSVALYVDGVYYGATIASVLALNNIERVEVLKGPQGTLFGRNATGGLLHVITRTPSQQAGANINLSYGSYDAVTANAYVTGGLTDTIAADVALVYSHNGEGFGRNYATGKPSYQIRHDFATRAKLLFEPIAGTTFTLSGDYADTDNSLNSSTLLGGTAAFPNGALASYASPWDTNTSRDSFTRGWQYGGSLRWDQSVGSFKLMSLTAYRQSRYTRSFDFDVTPNPQPNPVPTLPYQYFTSPQADRQFSQELQLLSPSTGAFTWVIGAFYYRAKGALDNLSLTFESPSGPFAPGGNAFIDSAVRTKSLAGFAQGTLKLGASTNLTGGVRYTDETKSIRGVASAQFTPTSAVVPGAPYIVRPDIVSHKFSFRASVDHHFTDAVMGYASFNRGFKSGGFAATAPGAPGYRPETLDAYEVGLKTELFDGRMRFNVSAFYYDYTDIQIQTVTAAGTQTTNGAAARIKGIDADYDIRLTSALRVTGGFQLIDDRFTSYRNALFGTPRGGLGQRAGDATGNRLPLASRVQATVSPQYTVALTDGGTVDLNVAYAYNSGWYSEADNISRQRAFHTVNASARWTLPGDNLTLMAWGRNLANEATFATQPTLPGGRFFVSYSPPRTYGVTLGAKF